MFSKASFKKILSKSAFLTILLSVVIAFTACENFMKGNDVKEEIVSAIEYNNAESYEINVEAKKGSGTIKTPASGEVTKKVTDTFTVRFEPSDDHKFIKWEAVVKDLSKGESASDYIVFENPDSLETKVTFKKASSKVIVIQPVCPARLTYSFTQGSGEIYPRDTSIVLNFNQPLAEDCEISPDYLTIQNLEEGTSTSTYFNNPVKDNTKVIFPSDTSNGYLPIPSGGQRAISVRIPKDKLWYICDLYTEPVKVYLDSDINATCFVNNETSKKVKIKYNLKQKNEQSLGTLKINGEEAGTKEYEYSVGSVVSVRYKLPDNYTFRNWSFVDSQGNAIPADKLNLTVSYEDNAETFGYDAASNVAQMSLNIYNPMEQTVTVYPQIYDPVKIVVAKGNDDNASIKAGDLLLTQQNTEFDYGIGKSISLKYKYSDAYKFYGWKLTRKYTQDGAVQTQEIALNEQALATINLKYSYDNYEETDGIDISSHTAQIIFTIKDYIDGTITITPDVRPIPVSKIKLDGEHGKFNPAKDTYDIKEGSVNNIGFEADNDYCFVCWKVYNAQTGDELTNQNYIKFEDAKNSNTTYTMEKTPENNLKLAVKPYVAERPQVLSYWPVYDAAEGSRSDTTIEIVFDREMDKESIFYSNDEVKQYQNAGHTLIESSTDKGRYCGYTTSTGETFYKNIQIIDKRSNINIAQYFGAPTFEDAATLFIPVKDPDALKAGMVVIVTINKDFYYTKEKVPVSLNSSEKWRYLSNGKRDTNRPAVSAPSSTTMTFAIDGLGLYDITGQTEPVIGSNGSGLNAFDNYFIKDKSSVSFALNNITVTDSESYPTSMFTLVCSRIYDEDYNKLSKPEEITKTIDYEYALGQEAKYNIEEHKTFELKDLEDGIYAVTYRFRDRSGNIRVIPDNGAPEDTAGDSTATIVNKAFYFAIDTKAPEINGNLAEVTESRGTNSFTIKLPEIAGGGKDVAECYLEYKALGTNDAYTKQTFAVTDTNVTVTGLATAGKSYEVRAVWKDRVGHVTTSNVITAYTKPNKPGALTCTVQSDKEIKITWTAPSNSEQSNYIVYYKKSDALNYSSRTLDSSKTSCIIASLSPKTEYNFYIVSKNGNVSGDQTSIVNANTLPGRATVKTISAGLIPVNGNINNVKPLLAIEWDKPAASTYDNLKLYWSTSEDFSTYLHSVDITDITSNTLQLCDGKNYTGCSNYSIDYDKIYYVKIVSSANVSNTTVTNTSNVKSRCSGLSKVANISTGKITDSSIELNWSLQAGAAISGEKYSVSYLSGSQPTIVKTGITDLSYTITGLSPDTKYTIIIKRTYQDTDGTKIESDEEKLNNVLTAPKPVQNLRVTYDENNEQFNLNWSNESQFKMIDYFVVKDGTVKLLDRKMEKHLEGLITIGDYTECPRSYSVTKSTLNTNGINGTFEFMIRTYNDFNNANSYSEKRIAASLPLKVTNFTAIKDDTSSQTKVDLTWDALPGETDFKYAVYWWKAGQNCPATPNDVVTTNSYSISSGLTKNTEYNFKVAIVDLQGNPKDGRGNMDNVSVTAVTPAKAVTNVQYHAFTLLSKYILIKWEIPADIGNYSKLIVRAKDTSGHIKEDTINPGITSYTTPTVSSDSFKYDSISDVYVFTKGDESGGGTGCNKSANGTVNNSLY